MSAADLKIATDFTEISLNGNAKDIKKLPRRRVYFSDGYLDEYSTEDEEDCGKPSSESQNLIDPKTLSWLPYVWYMAVMAGSKALTVCDYLGEHLAHFFGITTPKFQYEIDQCKRILEEEAALQKRLAEYNAGWGDKSKTKQNPVESAPVSNQLCFVDNETTSKESSLNKNNQIDSQKWQRF